MNHYKELTGLKIINAIIEYSLLFLAYFVACYIRMHISFGFLAPLYWFNVVEFAKKFVWFNLIAIILFAINGDYNTIHYRSLKKEITSLLTALFLCVVIDSAVFYWLEGWQFSRSLLVLYAAVSLLFIVLKRVLFDYVATCFFQPRLERYKIIVIGSGDFAARFFKGYLEDKKVFYSLMGYFSEHSSKKIDKIIHKNNSTAKYLGSPCDVAAYLEHNKIDKIIFADEHASRDLYIEVINLAMIYKVDIFAATVFNDFIMSSVISKEGSEFDYGGLHFIQLNAMKTENILGVNIAVTNIDKTISEIEEHLVDWKGEYICVSNVHTTVMAHDDPEYRKVQNGAIMALPDGGPLSAYSRGSGNTEARRVTGPDLMKEMLSRSGERPYRHFFYGSKPETLEKLREVIAVRYPEAVIAGMISPPFRELTKDEDERYTKEINDANPDFLWVGLGAPKQEKWMAAHKGKINSIMVGVGAAFDYEAGNIERAPKWMQKANLEWLYRLLQDPKRLFKRYFVTNIKYLWLTRK